MNGLKLNSTKTEVLHISSKFRTFKAFPPIEIDGIQVFPVRKARNLGVVFDSHFTLQDYVSSKCRSASYALYKINKIRPYIDKGTTERLVHAFVMCYIDYCNSLLYGFRRINFRNFKLYKILLQGLCQGQGKMNPFRPS